MQIIKGSKTRDISNIILDLRFSYFVVMSPDGLSLSHQFNLHEYRFYGVRRSIGSTLQNSPFYSNFFNLNIAGTVLNARLLLSNTLTCISMYLTNCYRCHFPKMKTDIDASSFNLGKYWIVLQILYYVWNLELKTFLQ